MNKSKADLIALILFWILYFIQGLTESKKEQIILGFICAFVFFVSVILHVRIETKGIAILIILSFIIVFMIELNNVDIVRF